MSADLLRLVTGHILSACVYCVAKLGVVDAMTPGEATPAGVIAERVGADPDALQRVLRALAAEGLFTEAARGTFATTETGELLRDGPYSLRHLALLHGEQTMPLFTHIVDTVRTGVPVPVLRDGRTRWEQMADDPEQAAVFNRAMRGRAARLREQLWRLDWSSVHTIVDVGGGIGGVLLPLLEREPHLRGVVFDLDHVADDAREAIGDAGLSERCDVAGGSFFDAVPRGGDVYLLSNVLHDWNDDDARRILATCRAAMTADARVIVVESLVPAGDEPHPVKLLDLQMLVALGGRERTEDEFRALFAASGLELASVEGDNPFALVALPV